MSGTASAPVVAVAIAARAGDDEDRADGQRRRDRGARGGGLGAVALDGGGGDDRASGIAQLAVGALRQPEAGTAARIGAPCPWAGSPRHRWEQAAAAERGGDRADGAVQLLIDAIEQEGALLGVGDATEREQANGGEREQPCGQAGAQRAHAQAARGKRRT